MLARLAPVLAEFGPLGCWIAPVARAWLARLPSTRGERFRLADNGDLLTYRGPNLSPAARRSLARALAAPSWLDPATGAPWL